MAKFRRSVRCAALVIPLLAVTSAAAVSDGPRPLRLMDHRVRSALTLGGEFGGLDDVTGLSLPVAVALELAPELALLVETPFGYVTAPGEVAEPLVGNLGVGLLISPAIDPRMRGPMSWALRIFGRVPTSPDPDDVPRVDRFVRLRSVTPFTAERWSPGAGALRLDVTGGWATRELSARLQAGGSAILPTDDRPATVHVHYGAQAGYRVRGPLWLMGELTGARIAPGAIAVPSGQYVTAQLGVRAELMRVSGALYVSLPIVGDVEGDSPVVIGIDLTSW